MEQFLLMPLSKYEELVKRLDEIELLLKGFQKGTPQVEGWFTENETRKFLGIGATTLWSLRKKRRVEYSKIGSKIFYRVKSIEQLLEKNAS